MKQRINVWGDAYPIHPDVIIMCWMPVLNYIIQPRNIYTHDVHTKTKKSPPKKDCHFPTQEAWGECIIALPTQEVIKWGTTRQRLHASCRNRKPQKLLMGIRNGAAILESSLAVLQMTKHGMTKWSGNSTTKDILPRNENTCPHKRLCMNVHGGIINNIPKFETSQMSINRWMNK